MANFMTSGTMSSMKEDWGTPKSLFRLLDDMFHFTIDPCATDENHLCERYYTREDDGLGHSWEGERVFMNPPYGKDIGLWTRKALSETEGGGASLSVWFRRGRTPDGGRRQSRATQTLSSSVDGSSMAMGNKQRHSLQPWSCGGDESQSGKVVEHETETNQVHDRGYGDKTNTFGSGERMDGGWMGTYRRSIRG